MEIQHFSHIHPLVLNEEPSHESDEKAYCCGCGEVVSGPTYSCVACRFHLDKNCAEAPSQMNHPFHRDHSFNLLTSSPYIGRWSSCNFCGKRCEKFIYHCSCKLDLHIKCALFSYNIAEKIIGELQHVAHKDPLISTENHSEELKEANCFVCWMPLLDSVYFSLDCGFFLHKKCVELPLEINHLFHRQHSLLLQFDTKSLPCKICQKTQVEGFVYCCSMCKFAFHIKCVSPSPIIEDSHEHQFNRCLRQFSFICDACGTSANYVSYICSICSLIVHKDCISLPSIIKSIWHHHPIFHNYFVVEYECGILECGICHEEVDKGYGSYYCFGCKFIVHVKCVLEDTDLYYQIESKDVYEKLNENPTLVDPSFHVIKEIKLGENVINREIKHFGHEHNLVLYDEVRDDKCCDCCGLLIDTYFYHCSECDFCLHKSCAALPRKKKFPLFPQISFKLTPNCLFICTICEFSYIGFAYIAAGGDSSSKYTCLQCSEFPLACTSQGHKEHLLFFYNKYNGQCNACGNSINDATAYRCKGCNFNLHFECTRLPQIARHKCDEHRLTLTYNEDNDYLEDYYCDICEEKRNPNIWFYHCTICDKSVHLKCVLGNYPFIKFGRRIFIETSHPHSLIFVKKVYLYPECCECGQPCSDLALECAECNYIIHWSCSKIDSDFIELAL